MNTIITQYIVIDPITEEAMCDPQSYDECVKEIGERFSDRLIIATVTWEKPDWVGVNKQ
jgi:hypothetical protein